MKLLKTIRFDPSDSHVFERAAEEGEWAISGGFRFSGITQKEITGKLRQAFANGFLSLESFGFSTFASVHKIELKEREELTEKLADKLFSDFGAPSPGAALAAAQDEISYVSNMCENVAKNSVFGVTRKLADSGEILESFRLIEKTDHQMHTKIWEIIE